MAGGKKTKASKKKVTTEATSSAPQPFPYLDGSFLEFGSEDELNRFLTHFAKRPISPPRVLPELYPQQKGYHDLDNQPQASGLWSFASWSRSSFNPAFVRAFYSNLRRDGDTIRSSINLYDIEIDLPTFARVAGLPIRGDDIATYGGDDWILNNEAVVIRELGITNLIRHSGAPTIHSFYSNLRRDGDTIRSSINLYDIEIDLPTFARVAGLPIRGDDIATYGGDDWILNNEAVVIRELGITNLIRHSGAPTIHSAPPDKRLLLYIITWILRPRDSSHTLLFNEDLKVIHAIIHGASINWAKFVMIHMADCASIATERSLPYVFLVMDLIISADISIAGPDTKMTKIWIIQDSTFRKKSGDRYDAGPSRAPAPAPAKASLQSIADTLNRLTLTVDGMGQSIERMDWTLQRQHHDMTAFFRGINYVPSPFHNTFLGQNYEGEDEEDDDEDFDA
ncbi:unnamed protein product [Cuscuta campestris]|uniref:Uncharacterized protein n=1 Tax=Cuscuta campestris TaxID=132261 RepID=A0A484KRZ2_9ASTE|nr:unnamed protein product [Cuscuta campestris]